MGYNARTWRQRIAERTDLSSHVVHLMRENDELRAVDVLLKILSEQCIRGSDPGSGFISGSRRAVCFQDAPLTGISQNVYYEEKYRKANPGARLRYRAIGLMFDKLYVFKAGGRPVIYDRPDDVKQYLPRDQWWRIVNFDLGDKDRIVDWTHEREWRLPGDFAFSRSEATVLLVNKAVYQQFVMGAQKTFAEGVAAVKSVVVLENLLF